MVARSCLGRQPCTPRKRSTQSKSRHCRDLDLLAGADNRTYWLALSTGDETQTNGLERLKRVVTIRTSSGLWERLGRHSSCLASIRRYGECNATLNWPRRPGCVTVETPG